MIEIRFTDRDLTPVGPTIVSFTQITVTLRFNEPAAVQLVVPAWPAYREVAVPGNRMVVIRDGQILVAGPIEYPGILSWSADGSNNDAGPGLLTIASTDDSVWLACRLVYPNPAQAATAQTTDFYTLSATNAEVAARTMVNLNAGVGALTARKVAHLDLGTLAGVGTNVNVRSRFDVLSDQLRAICTAGGGLGFRIRQDGTNLVFEVYAPGDLTTTMLFSRGLRNLRAFTFAPQAPTVTVAIVGGDGTGASRTIRERIATAAVAVWQRIEAWVANTSASTIDLDQAGDTALADGAEQGQLSAFAVDTPQQRFGVHYGLGDKVTVEIAVGSVISDVVRAVTITATKDGEVVIPQIGTASSSNDPVYLRMIRDALAHLAALEKG